MTRRVAVTGLGAVSHLGNDSKKNWRCLCDGVSGVGPLTFVSTPSFPVQHAGEVKHFRPADFRIPQKSLKVMNRTIQFAIAASHLAVQDARLTGADYPSREIGLFFGVNGIQYTAEELFLASYEAVDKDLRKYMSGHAAAGMAPVKTHDPALAVHPLWPLSVLANMSLCHIAIHQNFQGPNLAFSSLDAAGSQAIGEAFKAIRQGDMDVCVAGGAYALNTVDIISLASFHLLAGAADACRPFDESSRGCIAGEGSAVLILEDLSHALKRGATVYAEIAGFSSYCSGARDCYDMESGAADGKPLAACLEQALADASITAGDIDCIFADGKGAAPSDSMEAAALKRVFGTGTPVTTSKPLTGHMLAAGGAFQAFAAVLSVKEGIVPPAVNCGGPDSGYTVNLVKNPLKKQIKYAISDTFGFSGEHTALVVKHFNRETTQ